MAKERLRPRFPSKKDLAAVGVATAAVTYGLSQIREGGRPNAQEIISHVPLPQEEFQTYYLNVPVEADGFPSLFYEIQPGDTISRIAQSWGVPLEQIAAVNGIRNPDRIYAGQLLRMLPPVDFPNIIIGPVGFEEPENKHELEFFINGFNYYFQRLADLSFEETYYNPGELDSAPKSQEGLAHLYGLNADAESLNEVTSSGQRFNPKKLTCASWFYPIGSIVRVFYNGRSVECLVNDRGPNRLYRYEGGETKNVIIDLSVATAKKIEPEAGIAEGKIGEMFVTVELVSLPENWLEISPQLPTTPKR